HDAPASLWSHFFDAAIVEHNASDAVAHAEDAPRYNRRSGYRFHRTAGAEEHRQALVDDKQSLPVAFFIEHTDMRRLQPCGHFPVDGADIVARPIVPDLFEIQPASAHA